MRYFKTSRHTKTILLSLGLLLIGGVLLLKFDTAATAQFTDSVLRPLVGDQNVIRVEKVFFNVSDAAQKLENRTPRAPRFLGADKDTRIVARHNLKLDRLPVNGAFTPLPDEGVWKDKALSAFPGRTVAACTFMRPDPDRKFAVVTLVKVDTTALLLGTVAGTKQPGGALGHPGPGKAPADIVDSGRLVAAFDGGFLYRDGEGGMIVGDETYVPLKKDLGAIVGYRDGSLSILNYTGQPLGDNVAFVRQNCPILIEDGDITPLDPKNKGWWGRTDTASILTWRSGLGLDSDNNLVFAVGNNLTPTTLAIALQAAGAVNAIQLDINPGWTRFNWFSYRGDGKYSSTTFADWFTDGSEAFLHGSPKDFFYLYEKPGGPRLGSTVASVPPAVAPRAATRW
jgi:hypothetical protein